MLLLDIHFFINNVVNYQSDLDIVDTFVGNTLQISCKLLEYFVKIWENNSLRIIKKGVATYGRSET